MEGFVVKRMSELEHAILSNESEPNRLRLISRNMELVRRTVEQIVEAIKNDPEFRNKEDLATYLLPYLEYFLLLYQSVKGQSDDSFDIASDTVIEYKGKDIDLVEIGLALCLSGEFYVNGKPMTQEFMSKVIERLFGVDNWHGKVQDLKKRKNDPAGKLHALSKGLLSYLGKFGDDRARRR